MLAGAGSGKTKALTHRIAYLVRERKVSPLNILAVTFTNKAAGEMRRRVLVLLGLAEDNRTYLPFMGTFHSICVRILRREYESIGMKSNFLIFDASDGVSAVKQAMRNFQIDEKKFAPSLISNLISSAKNELITPSRYKDLAHGPAQDIAAKVYPEYQRILREAGALDFDDLIMETVMLYQKQPDALKRWQEQFRYIMIDEYQDTNFAQYQLTKLLARGHHNICVVGDDWQSIYSWRGANFQNILDFERDYPETQVIKLEQNYRSTKNILDAAHSVISKNLVRSDKKLWTDQEGGPQVVVAQVYNESQEGEFVVNAIERETRIAKRELRDFAILYRTNAQSRAIEETFLRHNLPYKIVGGLRFYERKEIKDALAYLRFVYQPEDFVSFNRIINLPPRGLGEKSLQVIMAHKREHGLGLLETLQQSSLVEGLLPRAAQAFQIFGDLISSLRKDAERLPPAGLLELILKKSGYLQYLDDGSVAASDRAENVKELLSVAEGYNELGLEGFLEEISLIADLDNYSTESNAVTLMTLHAAKGLEFPMVFMTGMEEGIFPHQRSIFDGEQMEEERRLCYVGMTRAKHQLFMLHAVSRMLYGKTQHNPPSRFLLDIPGGLLAGSNVTTQPPKIPDDPWHEKQELAVGDKIRHAKFGEGKVLDLDGDELTVSFAAGGQKRLSLSFAPIEKI